MYTNRSLDYPREASSRGGKNIGKTTTTKEDSTAYVRAILSLAWFAWTFVTRPEKSARTLRRLPVPPGMISLLRMRVLNMLGNSNRMVPSSTCTMPTRRAQRAHITCPAEIGRNDEFHAF